MPAIAAASIRALDLLEASGDLRKKLVENSQYFRSRMEKLGFKLAGAEYPVDAAGAARELKDALAQLFPERGDQRLDELLRKQAREGLTRAERTELQGFLTRPQGAPEGAHTGAGHRT